MRKRLLLKPAVDVFLVTGDTDIVVKAKFRNYTQLKMFLVEELSAVTGVKDTKTLMWWPPSRRRAN